jgi:hypothetical protein
LLATFVVTDPTDSLTDGVPTPNTLRWAVDQADRASQPEDPSVIEFDLAGVPTTIPLTQGPLVLNNAAVPIAIDGPGARALTIDAGGTSAVLSIDPGVKASVSGATLTGGYSYFGGGDVQNQGTLTLAGVTLTGGYSRYGGGMANYGTATLVDCTVSGNAAGEGGASATRVTAR